MGYDFKALETGKVELVVRNHSGDVNCKGKLEQKISFDVVEGEAYSFEFVGVELYHR